MPPTVRAACGLPVTARVAAAAMGPGCDGANTCSRASPDSGPVTARRISEVPPVATAVTARAKMLNNPTHLPPVIRSRRQSCKGLRVGVVVGAGVAT